jgi:DNA-binding transcriptional LysR family regulator
MLNVERLAVLHAVGHHESVTAAARALHLTPSAVSQQIAKLEREVGQSLVARDGRGIRLTNVGMLLAARARSVLDTLEELEGDLDSFRSIVGGPVRISAFPTAARGLGPALLLRLRSQTPDLDASLREQEPTESLSSLERGELDVVIAQDWFDSPLALPPSVSRQFLFDDVADIAVHRSHRFSRRRSIALEDLAEDAWVTWPQGSICHDWLLQTYRSKGIEPRIGHTASEHATQLALVAAGLGPAVIPRLGRGEVPPEVRMIQVQPPLRRRVFVAWRTNSPRRTNVEAVRAALTAIDMAPTGITRSQIGW